MIAVPLTEYAIELPSTSWRDDFPKPIMVYFRNEQDTAGHLFAFAFIDFNVPELRILDSYSQQNRKHIKRSGGIRDYVNELRGSPHGSVVFPKRDLFYSFLYPNANFFIKVDLKARMLYLINGGDLPLEGECRIEEFCSTCFRDEAHGDAFYFSAKARPKEDGEHDQGGEMVYFKASWDLQRIETVYGRPSPKHERAPHVTRMVDGRLFDSMFFYYRFKLDHFGKTFDTHGELCEFIFRDYYRNSSVLDRTVAAAALALRRAERVLRALKSGSITARFKGAIQALQSSSAGEALARRKIGKEYLMRLYSTIPRYAVSLAPGHIQTLDVRKQEQTTYETQVPVAAHFEMGFDGEHIYLSSHNLVPLGGTRVILFGPGAIEKISYRSGKVEWKGHFTHETSFRIINHRVFEYQGREIVCMVGFPNRLFFVDGASMELIFYDDIGEDVISRARGNLNEHLSVGSFLTGITGVEASDDGKNIFVMTPSCMYVYNLEKRQIEDTIPYRDLFESHGNPSQRLQPATVHSQLFEGALDPLCQPLVRKRGVLHATAARVS